MDASALERFLRNYEGISQSTSELNETDTKHMIVNPFLMALGWNFIPDEIQSEFRVKVGRNYQYADYCLKVEGNPVAFLEVKPFGSPLDLDSLGQVLAYGRIRFVRWCMITNGSEFIVLDSQTPSDSADEAEVFRFRFSEVKDSEHYLEAVSKDGFKSGLLDSLVEEIYEQRSLLRRFSEIREKVKERILKAISGVGLDDEIANQITDRFLTQVRGALEGGRLTMEVTREGPEERKAPERPPVTGVFPTIRRQDLPGPDDSLVAVFPARPEGEDFLQRFKAWAFVSIREKPAFCAIYFTKPEQRIRIVASVSRLTPALEWAQKNRNRTTEHDISTLDPKKYVIEFADEEAWELQDPIRWEEGDPIIYSLRYTSLGDFKSASRIGDLRSPTRSQ